MESSSAVAADRSSPTFDDVFARLSLVGQNNNGALRLLASKCDGQASAAALVDAQAVKDLIDAKLLNEDESVPTSVREALISCVGDLGEVLKSAGRITITKPVAKVEMERKAEDDDGDWGDYEEHGSPTKSGDLGATVNPFTRSAPLSRPNDPTGKLGPFDSKTGPL